MSPGASAPRRDKYAIPILLTAWLCGIIAVFYYKGRGLQDVVWLQFFDLLTNIPNILTNGLFWSLICCAALWVSFYSLGDLLLRSFRLGEITPIERFIVASGLGAGAVSLIMLFLGLAGLWHIWFIRIFFLVGFLVSLSGIVYQKWAGAKHKAVGHFDFKLPGGNSYGVLPYVSLGVIALAVLMNVLATSGPEISYDALVYHLALPKLYLLQGRIVPTPENLYSGIPFNMEMLYGLALAVSNEKLGALVSCSLGLGTTLAIWVWARRYVSMSAGIFAALAFYLCPPVLLGSWQSGVDIGAAFYTILAFIALSFRLKATDDDNSAGWSVIAGVFMGFACGVKYTLLPMGIVLVLIHLWARLRNGKTWRETVLMAVSMAVVVSPWLIKNWVFYGDPVYPFFTKLFGSTAPAQFAAFLADARSRNLAQTFGTLAGLKGFIVHPWDITIGDRVVDDWLGAVWLIFLPWLLISWRRIVNVDKSIANVRIALLLFGLFGYFSWYLTSEIIRFLIPILPFIACAIAMALEADVFPAWLRRLSWAAAILFCLFNFQGVSRLGEDWNMGRWGVLSGRQSAADYLKSEHMSYGAPYYSAMEYINQNLPKDAKVLFLGESRAFYSERNFVAATVFDDNPFWVEAGKAKTAAELYSKVKAMKVTHLFLSVTRLYTYAAMPTVMPRDVVGGKVFNDFYDSYLQVIFNEQKLGSNGKTNAWLIVYEIKDKSEKSSAITAMKNPFQVLLRALDQKKS